VEAGNGPEIAGYRIESLIARGGMAEVYVAENVRLSRTVALKVISPEYAEDPGFRDRFLRESQIAISIDHPNVIPVYDAGEADGRLYIAMRRVEDSDLRTLLRTGGPLDLRRANSIAMQMASALEAAHDRDLVHRDVKPANALILLRRSSSSFDHVYLSDFGVAKPTASTQGLTRTGQFVGTVNYTAPEQAEGNQVDARTDIYALGCVLFECLTGRPPFVNEEVVATVLAHLNEEPPDVMDLRTDCPSELAGVVSTMLAKDPGRRYQSCGAVIEALADAATSSTSMPTAKRTATAPASGGAGAAAAGAGLAAAGAGTGGGGEPPPRTKTAADVEDPASAPTRPSKPFEEDPKRSRRMLPAPVIGVICLLIGAAIAVGVTMLGGDDDEGSGESESAATPTGPAPETVSGDAPPTSKWRTLAPLPTPRQQAAAAVVGPRIWVVGGLKGGTEVTTTKKTLIYDSPINSWTFGPPLPARIHHPMAVGYDDQPVVIGGWEPKGANLTSRTSDTVYTLGSDGDWTELPPLNHPRAAGAAGVVGDQIIVAGGQDENGELVKETEVFDGESWQDNAEIPTPREHLGGAADDEYFYTVGGRNLSSSENTRAVERYDPAADRWDKLPNLPTETGSFGAAIAAEHLVAVGGEAPTEALENVQALNLKTEEWSELQALPDPVHGMGVAGIGSNVYSLGGAALVGHADSLSNAFALHFR